MLYNYHVVGCKNIPVGPSVSRSDNSWINCMKPDCSCCFKSHCSHLPCTDPSASLHSLSPSPTCSPFTHSLINSPSVTHPVFTITPCQIVSCDIFSQFPAFFSLLFDRLPGFWTFLFGPFDLFSCDSCRCLTQASTADLDPRDFPLLAVT